MTDATTNATEIARPRQQDELAARIAKLAGLLGSPNFPSADRAALKRWAPGQPIPFAFHRLWLLHLDEEPPGEGVTEAWALLAWGLASMGAGSHRPSRPLGRVLAETGFSEARLERLLDAHPELRAGLFVAMVRFLTSKDEGFDWVQAARFLLTRDADKREAIHRRIATDFYRQIKE